MTDAVIEKKEKTTLSASQVSDFLISNPNFFQEYEYLLADLILPHTAGTATSLVERQARVLRDRNSELRHRLGDLIAVARDNDHLFKLTKKLGLSLLEADSLEETARVLHHSLRNDFKVDCANIILFDQAELKSTTLITQLSSEAAKNVLGKLVRFDRISCSALRLNELQYLFPQYDQEAGSAAIIPLRYKKDLGLLVVGNFDPQHFCPDMETTFISYIGEVASRCIAQHL
ncbi:hypothetical protein A9Q99_14285 [Gammaproteobacteria bacterium 45_16_T64]|nr:hypothetical protein A9Q99_14285 [Gammaproteobacteria bacterium 45_16_T64]